jgi:hypothetical protein
MESDILERTRLYSAMNQGKSYRSYKKTILGKVYVTVLDAFSDSPIGVLLVGDPRKNDEGCIIDTWSEKEDVFFRKMNSLHLSSGTILPYTRSEKPKEKGIEEATDAELVELLNSKFFTLQNKLNSINTVPVLFRLLEKAQEIEKSDKIVRAIEARISEVQTNEDTPQPMVEEK